MTGRKQKKKVYISYAAPGKPLQMKCVDDGSNLFQKHFGGTMTERKKKEHTMSKKCWCKPEVVSFKKKLSFVGWAIIDERGNILTCGKLRPKLTEWERDQGCRLVKVKVTER